MLVQQLRLVIKLPVLYHRLEYPDLLNADALGIEAVFIFALGLTGALAISVVCLCLPAVGVSVTGLTAIESALGNIIGKNEANAGDSGSESEEVIQKGIVLS